MILLKDVFQCLKYEKIMFLFVVVVFTGKDQAHSANSDGEGNQSAAHFGGTTCDPTAPLIKQNIPG